MGSPSKLVQFYVSSGRFYNTVVFICERQLQQNLNASSREEYIRQILTVLLEIHRIYI